MAVNFFAMPSSSMLLLFSFAFSLTNALPWMGAQQTKVYREAAWSPAPTALPNVPAHIFKRESVDVNICGWIGGSSGVPAVCSAGSSCIHDTIHAIVGCCTTDGPCTAGVYTSCVDKNSVGWTPNEGMQNNGIYSCSGDAVCYRNTYPGGYYQYGCGASQDATSVETTYEGQASDLLLQVVFTGVNFSPFSAMATTTAASSSQSTSSSSLISSSSSLASSSSSSSSSSTTSASLSTSSASSTTTESSALVAVAKATPPAESSSASATAEDSEDKKKSSENKGAIAGAVIGSVLGLAAIVGFALWCGRRRRNKRIDNRAGSFVTQHHKSTPPTSGPFQRIAPYGPDDFGGMTQHQPTTTVTANDGGAATPGVFPPHYDYSNAYASLPSQSTPPQTPPLQRNIATHPGSSPGDFQTMYLPASTATASTPLVSQSEIDDFSHGYNSAIPSQDPGLERDTHIHTGAMPSLPSGGIIAAAAPMLLRGGSGSSANSFTPRRRSQNWGVTTEALRAQRPRVVSTPTPVQVQPQGWSPRGLSMRGSVSGSFAGTGSAGRGRVERSAGGGDGSPEWDVPPRSPLRSERLSAGGEGGVRVGDGVQRYQLVDEVVRDDVPILRSPGLRQGRGVRRESIKE
ncbi:hypothetical protein VTL71DRAFT_2142 [Oculimacula yallundae]|uniref:Mid2 domain-containing protein n=1 Tax=Oculimacula yallundae TaxID=86028 RepID=A0ABR4C808_9HELO